MQNLIKHNDDFLVTLYLQNQDTKALEVLFYRHKDKLLQSLLYWGLDLHEAEDLVQETFYKVIDSLNNNNYSCENKFFGWMIRIAKNLMIDIKRREKRGKELIMTRFEPSFFGYDTEDFEDTVLQKDLQKNQLETVLQHLDKLPYSQREILTLRIFEGMTFKDIAEKLDISINTALGRMRYSLINLRKVCEANQELSTEKN